MLTETQMEHIAHAGREGHETVFLNGYDCKLEVKADADGDEYASVAIPNKLRNGFMVEEQQSGNVVGVIRPTHIAVYF